MEIRNSKNVLKYMFGNGAIKNLRDILNSQIKNKNEDYCVFYIDHYFKEADIFKNYIEDLDVVVYVDSTNEPTTDQVDGYAEALRKLNKIPAAIIGIGGGCSLDVAKAVSNLMTNPGKAADYQGWDLVKNPGIYKVAIPTISGTGAEASRTCVMMNYEKNLKLGMNSEYTIYDQLIMDPTLTKTVPRDQYFYTAMDNYIHCVESLRGSYRHLVGDLFSMQALALCREVFDPTGDMMDLKNLEKNMLASYLGGCAIANSYVGVIHPFSAGLSVVLGIHHCLANCIVMSVMEDFYPDEVAEFKSFAKAQGISIPRGVCSNLTEEDYERLYLSTIVHEKPLANALGPNFKSILTREKVKYYFEKM